MMRGKSQGLLLAAFSVAALIGVGAPGGAAAAELVWRFAHENQETVPGAKAARRVADEVAKATDGKFEIQVYPAGQLGKEAQLIEQVQFGTVHMMFTPTGPLSNFEPRMQLPDLPFLFPTREAAYEVLDGPVGQDLLGALDKKGLKGLAFWESGFKQMTSSVRPILSPEDLAGQKMRTMQSPLLIAQYKSWGANPIPISFSETYNALQQGVADAQENPLVSINAMRLQEVQKYLTMTNHGYTAFVVVANKGAYERLKPEFRSALDRAVADARMWERAESKRIDDELLAQFRGKIEIHELPPEGRSAFIRVSRDFHKQYADKVTPEALQKVYAQTEKYLK
jgi:C4-dicarboxylate-binding protein DctP